LSHHLTQEFEHGLERLDMLVPDSPGTSGLVFVEEFPPPNEYERIALEKAKKYKADAVYFRRFDDGRAPKPQIYIYDFTSRQESEDEIAELHRRLWNAGQVPLFFIFTKTQVKIFNCLKNPDLDPETEKVVTSPMEIINLAAEVEKEIEKLKEFSARKFDNGSFWETSIYKDVFKLNDGSHETLLKSLKDIRKKIIKKNILGRNITDTLLVMSILVKYLEERRDEEGNTVFPRGFFSRFADGAENFVDVLKEKGACLELFDYLSRHFNGEIFEWKNRAEKDKLSQTNLTSFARFLEAKTEISGQGTLWPLYSFNDLPIELISNIYEEFLGDEKGVVYTPPYLVHFLVDEAMPLTKPIAGFKVLDPACGSGVFLVAAYQRIIDWWRIHNGWEKPDLNTLKKLLRDSIYGVDIDPKAVRLSIFSLSLALLDELSPKEIWGNLKFDDLKGNGNLYEKDFFELISDQKPGEKFDLVIGNPPFIENFKTESAKQIEERQQDERVQIPGKQLALLFLEQSMIALKDGGLLCLILPSGPFLYNKNALKFRKYFFQNYNIKQILDFTALNSVLFGKSDVATLALFAKKEEPGKTDILHIAVGRTKPSKEKIYFELDHYDFHHVPYKLALNDKLIWKSNLLGGGRLHYFISRIADLRNFGDYLKEKIKKSNWVVSEGFIRGNKAEINLLEKLKQKQKNHRLENGEREKLKELEKKFHTAGFLTGKKILPTIALTESGIDETQICSLEEKYFTCPRVKEIYEGPHVLIRELAGKNSIPIAFTEHNLTFKHQIIGIHSPPGDTDELKTIKKRIKNNRNYLFHLAALSGRYLISKATSILKNDIDNLPYPEDERELDLSEIEKILIDDVLDYMLDFRRRGENSKAVKPVPVNGKQLEQFGEIYCKILNMVYEKFKSYGPIITDSFVCFPIYYGDEPRLVADDLGNVERNLGQLVHKTFGRNLRMVRVLRLYHNNVVYLIKPNQVRYWLRSVAIRDADETFEDLIEQGY
jgi:type I restriction-modification system DNA methylase subunit